jgi:hypothetical protein
MFSGMESGSMTLASWMPGNPRPQTDGNGATPSLAVVPANRP